MPKFIYQVRGWILIRPLRYLSRWSARGSFGLRLMPRKNTMYPYYGWRYNMPNVHYWLLYKTVGELSTWMKWDAWRVFCNWEGGWRRTFPLPARIVMKIGDTMSYAFHGGECFHCAAEEGDPHNLTEDETGKYFELTDSGSNATEDGTDHWFRGITTCPKCGYKDEVQEGSL